MRQRSNPSSGQFSSWTVSTIASSTLFGLSLETLGLQALEPKTEAATLSVQHFDPVTMAIQKNKEHGVKRRDLDIQLDKRS